MLDIYRRDVRRLELKLERVHKLPERQTSDRAHKELKVHDTTVQLRAARARLATYEARRASA
jgi:hypothetical protein